MQNIRATKEEKKCPLCGKMDIGVEENGEFICRECFEKKYPDLVAEAKKAAASLLEGLDDIFPKQGDS